MMVGIKKPALHVAFGFTI